MRKILISLLAVLAIIGCRKDALDITPDGRMSIEDIFKNEIQAEAYLNTAYQSIPKYFKFYNGYQFLAGLTDEAEDSEVGNSPSMASQWNSGVLTPTYNPMTQTGPGPGGETNDFYMTFWRGIHHTNTFLMHIDETPFANPEKKSRVIAEARLLRAFFYLELCKQFGPMPIVTKPFEPNFDYTSLKRPAFQDITDFVITECNAAIQVESMPFTIGLGNELSRFSKAIAYSLKSQISLYNASPLWNPSNDVSKWESAASESKEAITVLEANGYRLAANYGEYFLTSKSLNITADKETIFEIYNPWTIPLTTIGIPSKEGSWTIGAQPSQELVDAYDMYTTGEPAVLGYRDNDHLDPIINAASGYDPKNPYEDRDPRFYATVWYNGAEYDNINGKKHVIETFIGGADQLIKSPPNRINTHTGYYLRKFIDPLLPINYGSSAQFKKYRLAELYLNFAEAENEATGANQDVYKAINKIRQRVGMKAIPAGLDKDRMRDRIRRERRVEFAWEEHRFWDVRRWKILGQTDKLVTGMEIVGGSGSDNIVIINPGFESGATGWSHSFATFVGKAQSGTMAAGIEGDNGGIIYQDVNVKPNTTYELSAWIRVTDTYGFIGVNSYGGNEVSFSHDQNNWAQKTVQFTTGQNNTTARVYSWWPAGGKGYIDDFKIKKISGGSVGDVPTSYKRFVVSRRNAWQDMFLIFPIPLQDASIIPDFTLNQNPGW